MSLLFLRDLCVSVGLSVRHFTGPLRHFVPVVTLTMILRDQQCRVYDLVVIDT